MVYYEGDTKSGVKLAESRRHSHTLSCNYVLITAKIALKCVITFTGSHLVLDNKPKL